MPLRHGEAFKERWDTLRRGLNLAVKALERDGLIKGAINPDDGLVYFRITPAGREAIAFR
jgi:DNA-binding MarR family transcriptional regulator